VPSRLSELQTRTRPRSNQIWVWGSIYVARWRTDSEVVLDELAQDRGRLPLANRQAPQPSAPVAPLQSRRFISNSGRSHGIRAWQVSNPARSQTTITGSPFMSPVEIAIRRWRGRSQPPGSAGTATDPPAWLRPIDREALKDPRREGKYR
jgi:hypothetical protein